MKYVDKNGRKIVVGDIRQDEQEYPPEYLRR